MSKIDSEKEWKNVREGIDSLFRHLQRGKSKKNRQSDNAMDIDEDDELIKRDKKNLSSWSKLYSNIFKICQMEETDSFDGMLLNKYKDIYNEFIDTYVIPSVLGANGSCETLGTLVEQWTDYNIAAKWLQVVFAHLKRRLQTHGRNVLYDVAMQQFKRKVVMELDQTVFSALSDVIHKDRTGNGMDRTVIRSVFEIFEMMHTHVHLSSSEDGHDSSSIKELRTKDMSPILRFVVQDEKAHCTNLARLWRGDGGGCASYFSRAENYLVEERGRVRAMFLSTWEKRIMDEAVSVLVRDNQDAMTACPATGVVQLLVENRVDDVKRINGLCAMVETHGVRSDIGLVPVARLFGKYVEKTVDEIHEKFKDEKKETSIVEELVEARDRFEVFRTTCFEKDTRFSYRMHNALVRSINRIPNISERLALYVDENLRGGSKRGEAEISDEDMDRKMTLSVLVFEYVSEKDIFQEFYRKLLAKRLLASAEGHMELLFLSKLKASQGIAFTTRLEGMINDRALSADFQRGYDEHQKTNNNLKGVAAAANMEVTVLTAAYWPSYDPTLINLPAEVSHAVDHFTNYYRSKTSSRKIQWMHSLSTAMITAKFGTMTYELSMSMFQMATLMLFNSGEADDDVKLTLQEVADRTNLSAEEAKSALASFSLGKHKILKKTPDTKTIKSEDVFEINENFRAKLRRIKIPTVKSRMSAEERKESNDNVLESRRYIVDAAIVRCMKARKEMGHTDLIAEVVEQLVKKFNPDVRVIKKQIESLIDRDFIMRKEDNPQNYEYVA